MMSRLLPGRGVESSRRNGGHHRGGNFELFSTFIRYFPMSRSCELLLREMTSPIFVIPKLFWTAKQGIIVVTTIRWTVQILPVVLKSMCLLALVSNI